MSLIYTTPRALRRPAGIVFLDPSERVPRSELDRIDRCYRAKREAEFARSWAEDATLVGTITFNDRASIGAQSSIRRRRRNNSVARRLGRKLKLHHLRNFFSTTPL